MAHLPQLIAVELVGGEYPKLAEGFEVRLDGDEEIVVQGGVHGEGSSDDVQPMQLEFSGADEVTEKDVLGCLKLFGLILCVPCYRGRVDFEAAQTTGLMC